MSDAPILHVVAGTWDGGPIATDELGDGFLHLCTEEQLEGELDRYFADVTDVTILEVDAAVLGDALVWEEGEPGELYPHLYATLPADAVLATRR